MMRLPLGKVPPSLLDKTVFRYLGVKRDDIVFGPSKGEDAGIVRVGKRLLAMHCDPISGAYSHIGWIAINIGTNDIATRGIQPRWVVACILLPEGSDEHLLESICRDMDAAARRLGVGIVGGHTEVTPDLSHPIVIVFPIGVAQGQRYTTCSNARPGSTIILTKSIAIEGTAILAHDREEPLRNRFGDDFVNHSKAYFDRLSVLTEALAAFRTGHVLSMHDPTEGGLAGGLNEMADAAGVGFKIYEDRIPITPETADICKFFEIDALALISSGALLIAAEPEKAEEVVRKVEGIGIPSAIIGEIMGQRDHRVIVKQDGGEEKLLMPPYDELWKALRQ